MGALLSLGGMELARNAYDEAGNLFLRALQLDAGNFLARRSLGNVLLLQGMFDEAVELFKGGVEIDPQNLEALTQIGVLLARGEHHDEAIKTFDMVLDIQSNYPHALFEKGLVYFQAKGQPREGVKVWEQLIETAPPDNEYAVAAKRMLDRIRATMPGPSSESPARPSGK